MSDEHLDEPTEPSAFPYWATYAWLLSLGIALAVFELFQQPVLLGPTVSLKFAWGDFLTAKWIRSRDPNRVRGRRHFWLYVSHGLWKATLVAMIIGFAVVFLDQAINGKAANRQQKPQNDVLMSIFGGSLFGALVIAFVASACSVRAILPACWSRSPMWLSSKVAADRVRQQWPPRHPGENKLAKNSLTASIALGFVGTMFFTIFVFGSGLDRKLGPGLATLIAFIPLMLFPVLVLVARDWLIRNIQATHPAAVWPTNEVIAENSDIPF